MAAHRDTSRIQTSLRLPRSLYQQAKDLLKGEASHGATFNELVIRALSSYIRLAARRKIDRAFVGMAGDAAYQEEARTISSEFEAADEESLELLDSENQSIGP